MPDATSGSAPRIETERLVLRAFEESDAASVMFYADPEVMRYIPRGPWRSDDVEAGFKRMVENRRVQWQNVGFGLWAIVLKETGAVIGHCGLQHIEGGDEVEVFYLLDKPYWNQGIATEAARAALRFATERGLTAVVALAYPDNHASQRVMEKAGLSPAGRARHYGAELVKYVARLAGVGRAESEPEDRNERV
jgi:ribosomal-protein-alanine N-acetyltransferase